MTEIFFEGDGILGIEWRNEGGKLVVKDILPKTVADEYYELHKGLIVKSINGEEYDSLSYIKKVSKIMELWHKDSEITLVFDELKIEHIPEIYNLLEECGFEKYYEKFIELGARSLTDCKYIEIDDLYQMKLSLDEALILYKKMNQKCNSEVFEEI